MANLVVLSLQMCSRVCLTPMNTDDNINIGQHIVQ